MLTPGFRPFHLSASIDSNKIYHKYSQVFTRSICVKWKQRQQWPPQRANSGQAMGLIKRLVITNAARDHQLFLEKKWNLFWWATFVVHATVEYSYYVTSLYLQDDFQRGGVTLLPRYELATIHSWERRCKQWSKDGVGLRTKQYFGKD